MIICIHFPELLDEDEAPLPEALEALRAMKRADHVIGVTARCCNRALREDPGLNPLWRIDPTFDINRWRKDAEIWKARYTDLVDLVARDFQNLVDWVDDGRQGFPLADLFLGNLYRTIEAAPTTWEKLAYLYGEPHESPPHQHPPQEELRRARRRGSPR